MQEYVLHGWSEEKCAKHRQNAREGNFRVQCDRDGTCVYTGMAHVSLSYEEYEMLNDVLDYANTREMLTKDRERRRTIIYLSNRLAEMQATKARLERGADGRSTNKS